MFLSFIGHGCHSRGSRTEQTLNDFARLSGTMTVQQGLAEIRQHEQMHLANVLLATTRTPAFGLPMGPIHPQARDISRVPQSRATLPDPCNTLCQAAAMQDASRVLGMRTYPHLQIQGNAEGIGDFGPPRHALNKVQDQAQIVQRAAHQDFNGITGWPSHT
jgi:hypothetical protein